jgi:hypothetical protein
MTLDRILVIIVLGLFGSITLLAGLYLLIKGNCLVGVPGLVFGTIFIIAFFLYMKLR